MLVSSQEHVFWVVSLNTSFILVFGKCLSLSFYFVSNYIIISLPSCTSIISHVTYQFTSSYDNGCSAKAVINVALHTFLRALIRQYAMDVVCKELMNAQFPYCINIPIIVIVGMQASVVWTISMVPHCL